jgi:RNA recognition motif-containing protein
LPPPADTSIATLWVGNVEPFISAQDLSGIFYAFGHIVNINIVAASRCAFVEYATRAEAEHAAKNLYNRLQINGHSLTLKWAKPRRQADESARSTPVTTQGHLVMAAPPGLEGSAVTNYGIPGLPPAAVPALAFGGHLVATQNHVGYIATDNRPPQPKRPRISSSNEVIEDA